LRPDSTFPALAAIASSGPGRAWRAYLAALAGNAALAAFALRARIAVEAVTASFALRTDRPGRTEGARFANQAAFAGRAGRAGFAIPPCRTDLAGWPCGTGRARNAFGSVETIAAGFAGRTRRAWRARVTLRAGRSILELGQSILDLLAQRGSQLEVFQAQIRDDRRALRLHLADLQHQHIDLALPVAPQLIDDERASIADDVRQQVIFVILQLAR
jgi:hypothetical protein